MLPLVTPAPVATVSFERGDEVDESAYFIPIEGFRDSDECSSEEEPCSPVSDGYYTPDDTIDI